MKKTCRMTAAGLPCQMHWVGSLPMLLVNAAGTGCSCKSIGGRTKRPGEQGRRHVHESIQQNAVPQEVRDAGLTKRATCHAFRQSFAKHLLSDECYIRTVHELMGHRDAQTIMI